jgi:hypothetical protein
MLAGAAIFTSSDINQQLQSLRDREAEFAAAAARQGCPPPPLYSPRTKVDQPPNQVIFEDK